MCIKKRKDTDLEVYKECSGPDFIQQITNDLTNCPLSISCLKRILHKAESTWGFPDFVQPHDYPFHITSSVEEFMYLTLAGVEGQVSNVQCGTQQQQPLLLQTGALQEIPNSMLWSIASR